jgi:hypothetical protein
VWLVVFKLKIAKCRQKFSCKKSMFPVEEFCYERFPCPGRIFLFLPAATTIGNSAFYLCTGLTTVSLPAATTIGDSAFYHCYDLSSLTFGRDTAPWPTLGSEVFAYTSSSWPLTIHVPPGTVSDYTSTWGVSASTANNGNTAVYGNFHKAITIVDTP